MGIIRSLIKETYGDEEIWDTYEALYQLLHFFRTEYLIEGLLW